MDRQDNSKISRAQAKQLLTEFFALEKNTDSQAGKQAVVEFLEQNNDPSLLKLIQVRNRLLIRLQRTGKLGT